MRITYLYAENMAGIKEGPKLDKIEIKFNKDKNKIFTLLLGGNGSGKTVTLSLLHPFRETYDGRSVVKDGEKAYKEIHIEDGRDEYVIKHTWKPNKSYISLNGEELNESGSIKLFNTIVKEKLGIDDDYFKIARLGSNVTNFINLTSGLRKTYVGNYLPYIDDYLSKYEIVKKKYTILNKDLNNVASQLDKFPELDILTEKAKDSSDMIEKYNMFMSKLNSKKAKLESSLDKEKELFEAKNNISCDEESIEYNNNKILELSNSYSKKKKSYILIKDKVAEKLNCDSSSLKSKKIFKKLLGEEEKNILQKKEELDRLNIEISKNIQSSDNLSKELEVYENMSSLDYKKEIENLLELINNDKDLIKQLKKELDSINKNGKYEYIKDLNLTLEEFLEIRNEIDSIYKSISILLNKYNIESDIDYSLLEKEKSITKKLTKLEERKKFLEDEIIFIDKNTKLISVLDNRPKNCKDNSCKFISNALDYKNNHYDNYDSYTKELDKINENIELYNHKISIISNTINFNKEVKSIYNSLIKFIEDYIEMTSLYEKIEGLSIKITNKVKIDFSLDIFINDFLTRDIGYILNCLNINEELLFFKKYHNLLDVTENLNKNSDRLKLLKKEKKNNDKIIERYEGIKEELNNTKKVIDSLHNKKNKLTIEIESIQENINYLNILINYIDELKSIKEEKTELINISNMYIEYLKKVKDINLELISIEDEINDTERMLNKLNKENKSINKDLNYVEVLSEDKKKLDTKFNYTKLIRDALDPKKGIPLLFIDKFLDNIEEKTNELLDLAYGSTFRIKFDLTDRDFFIKVYKTFSELEDISLASQGEISLTTVSLSLAMIQYMVKNYNILYLDEIDGTLSNQNRRIFLSMLEKQIEELGIEQIFIITHNKEFYSYPVNLILFNTDEIDFDINDSELMENKHIDFNLSEYKENKDSELIIKKDKRKKKKN